MNNQKLKICIITSQLLGARKIGGFGSMSKQLALSLSAKGHEVTVLMPQRKKKGKELNMLFSFPFKVVYLKKNQLPAKKIIQAINADIYHSQNQTILSSLVQWAEPKKKHIVTCRDPRDWQDWKNEFINATWRRRLKIPFNYLTEESILAYWAIKKANVVGVPAKFLISKVKKMYQLQTEVHFLPNIEQIPEKIPPKSPKPTVLWVGRMAKRKRPEDFIRLAAHFPKVTFQLLGKTEEKKRWEFLQQLAAPYSNVQFLGYKDKFKDTDFFDYYNQAWILVNTSTREGLPLTFIEGVGRGCAILSASNPDDFAEKFGYCARDKDFKKGLQFLLENDRWRKKGALGHQYVYDCYRKEVAIEAHLKIYKDLMG